MNRRARLIGALAAALAFGGCGRGEPPAPAVQAPQAVIVPLAEAHVLGRVIDGIGNPLRQVEVWIEAGGDAEAATATLVRSDERGCFRAVVPAPAVVSISIHAADLPPLLLAQRRPLRAGSTNDLGVIAVRSYPGLVVRVRADTLTPIAGALVRVQPQLLPHGLPPHASSVYVRSQRTDATGSSRLRALPPGHYVVAVHARGYQPREENLVYSAAAQHPQHLDIALEPAPELAGVIADSRAGAGKRVFAASLDGGAVLQTMADFSGSFRFDGLAAGPWRVGLDNDDGSRVWFGPVRAGASLTLPKLEGTPCTGTVRSAGGQALAGATVSLLPEPPLAPLPGLLVDRIETRSDANGRFRFDAVPPGRYDLGATSEDYSPRRLQLSTVPTDPMTIELTAAEPLRGRVVDAQGKPVTDASIECVALGNLGVLAGFVGGGDRLRTTADAEGGFAFRSLAEGSYVLRALAPGMAPACSAPLEIGGAHAPGLVELQVQPAAFCLGTVRRAGQPVTAGSVVALPRQPGDTGATANLAADGSYRLGPLPAGEHILVYSSEPQGAAPATAAEGRIRVALAAGEQRRVDFELP